MRTNNHISIEDDVRVEIYIDGKQCAAYQGEGYHTVDEAVRNAYSGTDCKNPIEDYVFRVENLSRGTSARYRIDAGDKLRILPEE